MSLPLQEFLADLQELPEKSREQFRLSLGNRSSAAR